VIYALHIARTGLLLPVDIPPENELRRLCTVPFTSELDKDTRHQWLSKKLRSHRACINELNTLFHPAAVRAANCQCFYFYDTFQKARGESSLSERGIFTEFGGFFTPLLLFRERTILQKNKKYLNSVFH